MYQSAFLTKIKVSRVSNLALYYNHSILSKGRHLLALSIVIFFVLNHRGTQGAGGAFFSVFASHFYISQPIFKNLQK
jgi:hypothetical protein